MLVELAGTPPQVLEHSEGALRIWALGKGLVFTQVSGRVLLSQADRLIAAVDAAIRERPGEAVVVHDLFDVESYEISVHPRMSSWSVATYRSVRRVVIGVRSPFISLAVRTINLAVGGRFDVMENRDQLHATARREYSFAQPRDAAR